VKIRTGVQVGKDISWDELDRFDCIFLQVQDSMSLLGIKGEELKSLER
jgi:NADPH-dependent glutamate synthase beta subunit-like oxidoreductase